MSTDARRRLVELLRTAAAYNDKGYLWCRHDEAQVLRYRQGAQETIVKLVAEIGEQAFSQALLERLLSGEAASDWSGAIYSQAKQELDQP
jgi:hypothetical protein